MTGVHATEMQTFLTCRLQWFWSAPKPRGLYLEPVSKHIALTFGTAIHEGLRHASDDAGSAYEAFKRTLDEELDGGFHLTFNWMEEETTNVDRQEYYDLGRSMLQEYYWYAKDHDQRFRTYAAETKWDTNGMSGRFDEVREDSDGLYVMDFKTTSRTIDMEEWARNSTQGLVYAWAARKLFGNDVQGVIFRFLKKGIPDTYEKLILKNGTLTTRKTVQNTTTFHAFYHAMEIASVMEACKITVGYAIDRMENNGLTEPEKNYVQILMQSANVVYAGILRELCDHNPFIWDVPVPTSKEYLDRMEKMLILPTAKLMAGRPFVGPTGLGTSSYDSPCKWCSFKEPCRSVRRESSGEYKRILHTQFKERSDQ